MTKKVVRSLSAFNASDIMLSDGIDHWYFDIEGEPKLMSETPDTPDTTLINQAGKQFGTWDPAYAHIQQSTWVGGRGKDRFVEDGFFDSKMAWTLTPNALCPVPQWRFAEGDVVASQCLLPGAKRNQVGDNVLWTSLTSGYRWARTFTTGSASQAINTAQFWIRMIGKPTGNLTFELRNNTAGAPGSTVHASGTLASSAITDTLSFLYEFSISYTLTATTQYWVVLYSSANDSPASHWEAGTGTEQAVAALKSTDGGSSWLSTGEQVYCRLAALRVNRRLFFFKLDGAQYIVDRKFSGSNSQIYLNGDRGKATSGTATTLSDTNKALVVDRYKNARIRILRGAGQGQNRKITGNTATQYSVSPAWDTNPGSDSEYVVYSTDEWQEVTGHGLGVVTGRPAVFNLISFFPQGAGTNMRRMRYNAAAVPPAHEFEADGTNKADLLTEGLVASTGVPQIFRALNVTVDVSRSDVKPWATASVFGTAIPCGGDEFPINEMRWNAGALWVFKHNVVGQVTADIYSELQIGLDAMPDDTNGQAVAIWNRFMYWNWVYSIEQYDLSGDVTDIGPWHGGGLPSNRRGAVSAMEPFVALLAESIDAGLDGYSSVLMWNRFGFTEAWRAWTTGVRTRSIALQGCPGGRPRLWIDAGGDLVVQEYAQNTLNPLEDSGIMYHHEAVLEAGLIDMDVANLHKFFNLLALTSRNLGTRASVAVEYQVDDDIGGAIWTPAEDIRLSSFDTADIVEGGRLALRYRMIMRTEDADVPPQVNGAVIEAFARTPTKYRWTMRVPVKSLARNADGNLAGDPTEFLAFLKAKSQEANRVMMRARWPWMDMLFCVVEPPVAQPGVIDNKGRWEGTINLTIRER